MVVLGWADDLVGHAVLGHERGPQRLVAPDDLRQRLAQDGDVEFAAEPEHRRDVVRRLPRRQLVEEPDLVL